MVFLQRLLIFTIIAMSLADAISQSSRRSSSSNRRYRGRLNTPYFYQNPGLGYQLNPYSPGYGQLNQSYSVRPVITPRATLPPVTGPVERYSAAEYGDIVKMAIDAARKNNPLGDSYTTRTTIVEMTTSTQGTSAPSYKPVQTHVSDILDRGIILLPNGEEVRLRGITIPSSTDTNGVNRLYGKEAMQVLRNLTQGKQVVILLDDPLRDVSGRLLGTMLLDDGTELNRRLIELGYGTVKEEDFGPVVDFSDMSTAQTNARDNRLGIWSSNF